MRLVFLSEQEAVALRLQVSGVGGIPSRRPVSIWTAYILVQTHPPNVDMAFECLQSRWRAVVARRAYLKRLALLNTTGDVVTRIQVRTLRRTFIAWNVMCPRAPHTMHSTTLSLRPNGV